MPHRATNMKQRLLCLAIAVGMLGVAMGCLYPDYGRRYDRGPYERCDRDRDDRDDDRHQPAPGFPH